MSILDKIDEYLNKNDDKSFDMVIDQLGLPKTNTTIYKHFKTKNGYELMVVKFKNKYFGMEIAEKQPQVWEGSLKKVKSEIEKDTGIKI